METKSKTGIRVRVAKLDDIPTAMSFAAHAATAANWSHKQYVAAFSDAEYHMCLIVEDHGEVMGFAVARMLPGEWEVENIAVAGAARRRGLATRLMGELMERARAADAKQVFLEVRESNHAARALYEKWAFEPAGRRKSYYQNPIEDAVMYRFSFPQAPKSN
jgi:[ribosomal protein S18]-alanine N-acetyltransferase